MLGCQNKICVQMRPSIHDHFHSINFLSNIQARIAFLQGERKGQENLKNDLVRRIKMLEYALKQERAKYAKLKYGGDSGQAIVAANALDATR